MKRKALQIRCFKTTRFWIRFLNGFSSFWPPKTKAKWAIFVSWMKTLILQKSLFSVGGKLLFFWFGASKNQSQSDAQTHWKITSHKKAWKIEFGGPFALPKSLKIGSKSDVKRILLRDAMELTRKSSQVNGSRDPWTAKKALHMIRSTLSIYLCIDFPVVALIILSVCCVVLLAPDVSPHMLP